MRTTRCVVDDPHEFVCGQLPDGRWVVGVDYVNGVVEWCDDEAVHPDNPRPGPLGRMPSGFDLGGGSGASGIAVL